MEKIFPIEATRNEFYEVYQGYVELREKATREHAYGIVDECDKALESMQNTKQRLDVERQKQWN